uniref:Uncharacterized protein n=1 Tax=Sphaerodactylus townsendi TaxID=933632 RepID=A0ACB8FRN5_9SAUR
MNVNDESPVCKPPHYEKWIYSTIKTSVLQLNCSDKDSPAHQLSYNIVGGNGHNRFKLQRQGSGPPSLVTTQNFQYDVFRGIKDPTTFQLLIEVADEMGAYLPKRLSTTATVIIHVIPWSTTKPSTTTKTTTTAVTTAVLFRISYYWHPKNWFAAVLTITGALLLMSLYMAACLCFKNVPKCGMLFPKCCTDESHPLLANTEQIATSPRKMNPPEKLPTSEKKSLHVIPNTPATYDGRAMDQVTGMQYLFNSKTGDVQWLNKNIPTV